MNKLLWFIALIVFMCAISIRLSFAGTYVTFKNSVTGVRYYGDAIPANIPHNTRVEIRQHSGTPVIHGHRPIPIISNQRVIGPSFNAVAPKSSTSIQMNQNYIMDRIDYMASKPTKPDNSRVFREFNIMTDQREKYEADMFEWRSRGRELRQQYNDPLGTQFWK